MGRPPLRPVDTSVDVWITDQEDQSKVHRLNRWNSYNITLGVDQPANSFSLDFAGTTEQRALVSKTGGQTVLIMSHGSLQIYGITQERSDATGESSTDCQITGRSTSGLLIDSAVPLNQLSMSGLPMAKLVERWVAPWEPDYITSIVYDNAASRYILAGAIKGATRGRLVYDPSNTLIPYKVVKPKKGTVARGKFGKRSPVYRGIQTEALRHTRLEKGTKVMAAIQMLAEQIGCIVFQGADGSLVITRPCYDFDPSAYGDGLQLLWDKDNNRGRGGNVLEVKCEASIAERASEYTIVSSVKSKKDERGAGLFHTKTIKDPSPAFWGRTAAGEPTVARLHKPDVLNVKGLASRTIVSRMARRTMTENAIDGLSLTYMVAGHHAPTGALYAPDSMINVLDERNKIRGPHYITKVERSFDEGNGRHTVLHLIPPHVWLGDFDADSTAASTFDREMAKRIWW